MELAEVVRRRRMVRSYSPEPVDVGAVNRMLAHALQAPSAGFSQGWGFLVLDAAPDVARFWAVTTPPERAAEPDGWLLGMRRAPVVVVPFSAKGAYLDRYAEPDKGWTDRDEGRWQVPYWHVDAGMAALLVLLTAVDEGLGACFFGIPAAGVAPLREAFGVPDAFAPVGAITVGYPAPGDRAGAERTTGSPAQRRRRSADEVVHRGHWST